MSFSQDIEKEIDRFAKEQSLHYLDAAEMTYIEKLRQKADAAKRKAGSKMARFKSRSEQAVDAQNDMILYMSDFMSDLMSEGMTESEAFEKAKEELAVSSDSEFSTGLQDKYRQYYEGFDPAGYEAIGLFYAGFTTLGLVLGALTAYILSGGRQEFLSGGWIDTLIGAGVGVLIGAACGQISHAVIAKRKGR